MSEKEKDPQRERVNIINNNLTLIPEREEKTDPQADKQTNRRTSKDAGYICEAKIPLSQPNVAHNVLVLRFPFFVRPLRKISRSP